MSISKSPSQYQMDPSLNQMQEKRKGYRLGNNAPVGAIGPQGKSQFHHDRMAVLRKKAPEQRDGSPGDNQSHGDGKGQGAYGRGHRILGEQYKSDGAKPNEHRHSHGAIHEHGNGGGNC